MKHSNIAIFVPHAGCPHKCSFCDQRTISGAQHSPTGLETAQICSQAVTEMNEPENAEIAFFGGSFTAINREYMLELLQAAHPFVKEGKVRGIRISTRPDCITPEILDILKRYGVTAIELGAQSMVDEVLAANERGHTAGDAAEASQLIRSYGFELGLQMMTGLYKSSPERDMLTMQRIIDLSPDTVRIYPTVVLKGTVLADIMKPEDYITLDEMAQLCALMLLRFHEAGIRVIKCGLHASEFVEHDMVAGYYHPAFRELCESRIYLKRIEEYAKYCGYIRIAVPARDISKAVGHKKSNIEYMKSKGVEVQIVPSASDKTEIIERR
ncbi:MAG: radical SAM protein [Ruminococcus sp.]|nr:radical SAM protein [Ruminococcus sp.]